MVKSLEDFKKRYENRFKELEKKLIEKGYIPLERTLSVDDRLPIDLKHLPKVIPAVYAEKSGIVYLIKTNGTEERIGTKAYWNRIKKYAPSKRFYANTQRAFVSPLINCGLCTNHRNSTTLYNIVVTNRCNLRCWYCFFFSEKSGYVYEPSLNEIEKMIRVARAFNGFTPPIQITGGEPTIRKDLGKIIKLAKKLGSPHIQLNTHSQIIGMKRFLEKYLFETDEIEKMTPEEKEWLVFFTSENGKIVSVVDELKEWKRNGLNTIYTSFDGVSEKINGYKNHYELPYALEAYNKAGIKSIVLVPTVHKENIDEIIPIVKFAINNKERGIKGVNFQPISLVGLASKKEREKLRITQSDIVERMEYFGLKIEDWFPVPTAEHIADVIGKITKRDNWVRFYNNEKCGLATYVYPYKGKLIPITEFIDVDGFLKYVSDIDNNIDSLKGKLKLVFGLLPTLPGGIYYILREKSPKAFILEKLFEFIREPVLPDGTDLKKLIATVVLRGDYSSLGKFHEKFQFYGMMHFMDPYNYDAERVQRCSIHYGSPDGRIIPFCTFNVFPQIYRDLVMKRYQLYGSEAEKKKSEEIQLARKTAQFRKLFKEKMKQKPEYQEYYLGLI